MRGSCHDADAAAADAGVNMAMKALRGMVNGAMSELSSAVSGTRATAAAPASTAASREHALAVKRDYNSQPRLSESGVVIVPAVVIKNMHEGEEQSH